MSGYEELLRQVHGANEVAKQTNGEYPPGKITITMQSTITGEPLKLIQKKYIDNLDLTIVRGPVHNTITITGYRDQVRENQEALLKDVRDWDTGAKYLPTA